MLYGENMQRTWMQCRSLYKFAPNLCNKTWLPTSCNWTCDKKEVGYVWRNKCETGGDREKHLIVLLTIYPKRLAFYLTQASSFWTNSLHIVRDRQNANLNKLAMLSLSLSQMENAIMIGANQGVIVIASLLYNGKGWYARKVGICAKSVNHQ